MYLTSSRALLVGLPVLALALAAAVSPPSEAERQHLARLEPLRVCADPSDHPLDFIDADGVHRGIAADLLAEISERLGISTRLVPTETWDHTLELARRGECDVVAMLNATPSRAAYLNFTRPYATFENVIVANRPVYHRGLASLAGRTVALPEGYRFLELITREYPDIRVLTVSSSAEAVEAVSRGEAYATIVNQQRLVGDLQRLRLKNLHYAGDAQVQDVYRFGIRKDDEVLLRMMDHGLSLVPAAEIDRIMNRW
jgi:ABC-type amino acid transport substrate-binding protein